MMTRISSLTLLALGLGLLGCSVAETDDAGDPTLDLDPAAATSPVEETTQYNDCRDNGHSTDIDLGQVNAARDPGTRAAFATASCIVGRLTQFRGTFRPYNLQSFKNLPGNEARFFFKRISNNVTGEPASECLKIKMTSTVSPTDVYVTITRVKVLPPPRADGLCTDNGEI
ncbi:MAG: hypothetical protein R3B48_11760 [Kofleriaceae bacterium]